MVRMTLMHVARHKPHFGGPLAPCDVIGELLLIGAIGHSAYLFREKLALRAPPAQKSAKALNCR